MSTFLHKTHARNLKVNRRLRSQRGHKLILQHEESLLKKITSYTATQIPSFLAQVVSCGRFAFFQKSVRQLSLVADNICLCLQGEDGAQSLATHCPSEVSLVFPHKAEHSLCSTRKFANNVSARITARSVSALELCPSIVLIFGVLASANPARMCFCVFVCLSISSYPPCDMFMSDSHDVHLA